MTPLQIITHALFDVVAYQQYIEPLRDEVKSLIDEHGWNKTSISKMYKLDSFLRESIRISGVSTG